jgi:hypothetical protein
MGKQAKKRLYICSFESDETEVIQIAIIQAANEDSLESITRECELYLLQATDEVHRLADFWQVTPTLLRQDASGIENTFFITDPEGSVKGKEAVNEQQA